MHRKSVFLGLHVLYTMAGIKSKPPSGKREGILGERTRLLRATAAGSDPTSGQTSDSRSPGGSCNDNIYGEIFRLIQERHRDETKRQALLELLVGTVGTQQGVPWATHQTTPGWLSMVPRDSGAQDSRRKQSEVVRRPTIWSLPDICGIFPELQARRQTVHSSDREPTLRVPSDAILRDFRRSPGFRDFLTEA